MFSGIVTWIASQIDTQNNDAWKSLANRCLLDGEVTAAKQTLKNVKGPVLENLVPDFKKNRSGGGKKIAEIDDIKNALVALQSAGEMPLVLATSGQMVRCPQSWGVPETATVQDVMGKVIMLEQVIASNMETQKLQMEQVKQEIISLKKFDPPKSPCFPEIRITEDTPTSRYQKDG